jgi:hypothetical protein
MKKFLLAASIMFTFTACDTARQILSQDGLTSQEVASGLKEALSIGAQNSSSRLSMQNGFFGNAILKIWMPPEAQKVESILRGVGFGATVDKAVLAMNRAAEEAAKSAGSIFVDAVRQMTIQDAIGILRGGDTTATNYLRRTTYQTLFNAFKPAINNALAKTEATKYWNEVFTVYNQFSKTPVTTDLSSYVTQRAIDGIFYEIRNEEIKIRQDPAARVTEILKKVFGSNLAQQRR